jgi:hypothetical protein
MDPGEGCAAALRAILLWLVIAVLAWLMCGALAEAVGQLWQAL